MKKSLFILIGIAVLLLGSCARETITDPGRTDDRPVPVNTLRLSIDIPGGPQTRATMDALPEEMVLGNLYLLFFESKADATGEFVDYVQITDIAEPGKTWWDIDMVDTRIDVTSPYHILAVANVGEQYLNGAAFSSWVLQWAGKNELQVMAEATAWTQANPASPAVLPTELLMSGRVEKPKDTFKVTIPMTRNQVRFDVHNDVKTKYQVVSVEIRNAYPSASIWNVGAPDYSDNTGRIPRYYAYDPTTDPQYGGEVTGHLYAFENQVSMPSRNDRFTTCLIVGLKDQANAVTYYRINIAPVESAQMLKHNNTYRVTIRGVGGPGQSTADEACDFPDDNQLDYTINNWDNTATGVMALDGSSLLSAPYKTVVLPRAELRQENGNTVESTAKTSFDIYTFTNSADSVSGLEIVEQAYTRDNTSGEYRGVNAALNGNVLTITADPIPSGQTVRGYVKLGYAGLRVTIDVLQTDLVTDFLQVHLPDGGIPRFAPFGGIQSGILRVEASDAWTAELYAPDGGFSLTDPVSGVPAKIRLTSAELAEPRFRIWTHNDNASSKPREAFLMVTLDKDPENYSRVIRVSQEATAGIAIVPKQTVTFDGMGKLALIPNNTVSRFTVRPSAVGDPTPVLAGWNYAIEGDADHAFAIDTDPSKTNSTTNINNPDGNFVTVKAVGKNTSGRTYTAKLVVYLTAQSTVRASIDLVQFSEGIELSPNTVPAIPKVGGDSPLISVQADASLQWQITDFTVTGTDGTRSLVHHDAELLDQSGDPITLNTPYAVAGDQFKVRFPKIYYPNRDIPVSATVKVQIVGSELTRSITVNQTPLTATAFSAAAPQTAGYGNLHGGSYNIFFRNGIRGLGAISSSVSAGSNFFYTTTYGMNASYPWTLTNNFRDTRDGLTMIVSDYDDRNAVGALNNAFSPLRKANITLGDNDGSVAVLNHGPSTTKIYQILVSRGYGTPISTGTSMSFYADGICTQAYTYPDTAIPVIVQSGTDRAFLVVDPKNQFIFLGESQVFDTAAGNALLSNLLVYIKNASRYGSHFTDLLVEQEDGGQPAPWDSYWGANAGVTR